MSPEETPTPALGNLAAHAPEFTSAYCLPRVTQPETVGAIIPAMTGRLTERQDRQTAPAWFAAAGH
jgi:hypothetical protein